MRKTVHTCTGTCVHAHAHVRAHTHPQTHTHTPLVGSTLLILKQLKLNESRFLIPFCPFLYVEMISILYMFAVIATCAYPRWLACFAGLHT